MCKCIASQDTANCGVGKWWRVFPLQGTVEIAFESKVFDTSSAITYPCGTGMVPVRGRSELLVAKDDWAGGIHTQCWALASCLQLAQACCWGTQNKGRFEVKLGRGLIVHFGEDGSKTRSRLKVTFSWKSRCAWSDWWEIGAMDRATYRICGGHQRLSQKRGVVTCIYFGW